MQDRTGKSNIKLLNLQNKTVRVGELHHEENMTHFVETKRCDFIWKATMTMEKEKEIKRNLYINYSKSAETKGKEKLFSTVG